MFALGRKKQELFLCGMGPVYGVQGWTAHLHGQPGLLGLCWGWEGEGPRPLAGEEALGPHVTPQL